MPTAAGSVSFSPPPFPDPDPSRSHTIMAGYEGEIGA